MRPARERAPRTVARKHTGWVLVEALIAILLIGFGLVGVARLQARALADTKSTQGRGAAQRLADEMSDRIRANLAGAAGGAYALLSGPGAAQPCATTGCADPAAIARNDLHEWQSAIARSLPAFGGQPATGVVCATGTPFEAAATPAAPACDGAGPLIAIKIWWGEHGERQALFTAVRP